MYRKKTVECTRETGSYPHPRVNYFILLNIDIRLATQVRLRAS